MGDQPPRLSVVIPCRNEAAVVGRQLEALTTQEVAQPWEVVVVDNGSTDRTVAVVEAFRGRLPALRVVHEPKPGRHHAVNAGVRSAASDRLVMIDADDEVSSGFLEAMSAGLDESDLVSGSILRSSLAPNGRVVRVAATGYVQGGGLGLLPWVPGGAMGVRRAAFEQVNGFADDASYCEDIDFSWRAQLAGASVGFAIDAEITVWDRGNLSAMFRQHRNFGRAQAWLYRRFKSDGMPRRSLSDAGREWRMGLTGLVSAVRGDHELRMRVVRRVGRIVGRLEGCLRYRVWYP